MVGPSSESVKDKVQSNQGVVQWAIQGVKVGAIAALIQVLIVGTFGGILFDMMQDSEVFKVLLLFFLAIILLACLGGIIAGFVSSRLGTKERKFGATVGGLIMGFSPTIVVLVFLSFNLFQSIQESALPKHDVWYTGYTSYLIFVSNDFSEHDAQSVASFYKRKEGAEGAFRVIFRCGPPGDTIYESYNNAHTLYIYNWDSKDSSPTISTSKSPSLPNQGEACK